MQASVSNYSMKSDTKSPVIELIEHNKSMCESVRFKVNIISWCQYE